MADFDVFNGDADGLCALHQLRLSEPRRATLVTGVKRDIALLGRIVEQVRTGDRVTVLDIAVEPNRPALDAVLGRGAGVRWFDHHLPGPLPDTPALEAIIELSPEVCTSLLVDRHLGGCHRAWAIVAAFGDGLATVAGRLAADAGFPAHDAAALRRLGEAINYNAYGDSVDDLLLPPDRLYARIARHEDPLGFLRDDPVAGELSVLMTRDLALAEGVDPVIDAPHGIAYVLPDEAWARRINGPFANAIADRFPGKAIAVLTHRSGGALQASVRAPRKRPQGAAEFCQRYPTGGGRSGAGGVNRLDSDAVTAFLDDFVRHFARPEGAGD